MRNVCFVGCLVAVSLSLSAFAQVCPSPRVRDISPLMRAVQEDRALVQTFQKAAQVCAQGGGDACDQARNECNAMLSGTLKAQVDLDDNAWLRDMVVPYVGNTYPMQTPIQVGTAATDVSCSVSVNELSAAAARRLKQSERRQALLNEYPKYARWANDMYKRCQLQAQSDAQRAEQQRAEQQRLAAAAAAAAEAERLRQSAEAERRKQAEEQARKQREAQETARERQERQAREARERQEQQARDAKEAQERAARDAKEAREEQLKNQKEAQERAARDAKEAREEQEKRAREAQEQARRDREGAEERARREREEAADRAQKEREDAKEEAKRQREEAEERAEKERDRLKKEKEEALERAQEERERLQREKEEAAEKAKREKEEAVERAKEEARRAEELRRVGEREAQKEALKQQRAQLLAQADAELEAAEADIAARRAALEQQGVEEAEARRLAALKKKQDLLAKADDVSVVFLDERPRGGIGILGGGGYGSVGDGTTAFSGPMLGTQAMLHFGFWGTAPSEGLASGVDVRILGRFVQGLGSSTYLRSIGGVAALRYFFGPLGVGAAGEARLFTATMGAVAPDSTRSATHFAIGPAVSVAMVDNPNVRVMLNAQWMVLDGNGPDLYRFTGDLEVSYEVFTMSIAGGTETDVGGTVTQPSWWVGLFAGVRLRM